jgi:hypothetical protein
MYLAPCTHSARLLVPEMREAYTQTDFSTFESIVLDDFWPNTLRYLVVMYFFANTLGYPKVAQILSFRLCKPGYFPKPRDISGY